MFDDYVAEDYTDWGLVPAPKHCTISTGACTIPNCQHLVEVGAGVEQGQDQGEPDGVELDVDPGDASDFNVVFEPQWKQWLAYEKLQDDTTIEVLYGGAANTGKTWFGCAWVLLSAILYPGTRWMICREDFVALRATTMKTFWGIMQEWGMQPKKHYGYAGSPLSQLTLFNGSEILFRHLNHDKTGMYTSLGSYELTGAFVDECTQVDEAAWSTLSVRIRYRLEEYGLTPKILGSCNPEPGWVMSRFYVPLKKDELKPTQAFIQALPKDNKYRDRHNEKLMKEQLTPQRYQALYEGRWEFSDDELALFQGEMLERARACLNASGEALSLEGRYITCDAAGRGKDASVILVWYGDVAVHWIRLEKNTQPELAQKILETMKRYKVPEDHVVIDSDGIGGAAEEILADIHDVHVHRFHNNAKPLHGQNYEHLKAQCYYELARSGFGLQLQGRLKAGKNEQDVVDVVFDELRAVRQAMAGAKVAINKKDDQKRLLGRSPDFGDALMLRKYFTLIGFDGGGDDFTFV